MEISEAQRDVRITYVGGFMGQLVSSCLWLAAAALGTWGTPRQAIVTLIVGGFFIFPLTWVGLRLTGHPARTRPGNPLKQLAVQVAFTLPLVLPLVGAATLHRLDWFFPSFMIALGAHYLPFTFLYGMKLYAGLCAVLVAGGLTLGMWGPASFALGGWVTGVVLLAAALLGRIAVGRELRRSVAPA